MKIDLNCDVGEFAAAVADGTQEQLMRSLTSVNIACGGHAGDDATMRATVEQALRCGVAIGAHPGYADRENFGRVELRLSADEVAESVYGQVSALAKIAEECGARVGHVKPHGALYNQAAKDGELARAIARGVARWNRDVVMVGLAGSVMLEVFREAGFLAAAEAFADRRYEADGSLRSRRFADALISDPAEAAEQAVRIVERGNVLSWDGAEIAIDAQTICLHGDTFGAPQIASVIGMKLRDAVISVQALDGRADLNLHEWRPTWEEVFTVTDYYDGPRKGLANFKGKPHFYDCIFLDDKDVYSDLFRLSPLDAETFELAMEDWEIWKKWELAFKSGEVDLTTHPALPAETNRHSELERILKTRLLTSSQEAAVRAGRFKTDKDRRTWVEWSPSGNRLKNE